MRALLLSVLLSAKAQAEVPQQYMPIPFSGTIYLDPALCPVECFPLLQNGVLLDPEIAVLEGTGSDRHLVEDPSKKAAKAAREAQKAAEKAEKDRKSKEASLELDALTGKTSLTQKEIEAAVIQLLKERAAKQ